MSNLASPETARSALGACRIEPPGKNTVNLFFFGSVGGLLDNAESVVIDVGPFDLSLAFCRLTLPHPLTLQFVRWSTKSFIQAACLTLDCQLSIKDHLSSHQPHHRLLFPQESYFRTTNTQSSLTNLDSLPRRPKQVTSAQARPKQPISSPAHHLQNQPK